MELNPPMQANEWDSAIGSRINAVVHIRHEYLLFGRLFLSCFIQSIRVHHFHFIIYYNEKIDFMLFLLFLFLFYFLFTVLFCIVIVVVIGFCSPLALYFIYCFINLLYMVFFLVYHMIHIHTHTTSMAMIIYDYVIVFSL